MKGKVIKRTDPNAIPPTGATGEIKQLKNGDWAFIPDNLNYWPRHEGFMFFQFEKNEIEVLK